MMAIYFLNACVVYHINGMNLQCYPAAHHGTTPWDNTALRAILISVETDAAGQTGMAYHLIYISCNLGRHEMPYQLFNST
jgi:hypothetical protein